MNIPKGAFVKAVCRVQTFTTRLLNADYLVARSGWLRTSLLVSLFPFTRDRSASTHPSTPPSDVFAATGRIGTPQDVANFVSFLASPDSDYITGAGYKVISTTVPSADAGSVRADLVLGQSISVDGGINFD
jgi:NAD(P)-dependent dehydrogenase (short-subunit alcohol dehydrogenase family)